MKRNVQHPAQRTLYRIYFTCTPLECQEHLLKNGSFCPIFYARRTKLPAGICGSPLTTNTSRGRIAPFAGVVELADTLDLGSNGQPCRFKSCRPYQKRSNFCLPKVTSFFYPSRRLGISSRFSVYIIAVGVYHHRRCILLRLDEMQHFVLMIYNASH